VAHSVPFVAKEAGFFAEEGINAEIIHTAGSVASGERSRYDDYVGLLDDGFRRPAGY
jgi:hypothetical protein